MLFDGSSAVPQNEALVINSAAVAAGAPKLKVEYAYDGGSRRAQRKTYSWDAGNSQWQLDRNERYVYDGWNLVAVYDGGGSLLRTFTWGLDLSGSPQGAGGVGGLLGWREVAGGARQLKFPISDSYNSRFVWRVRP